MKNFGKVTISINFGLLGFVGNAQANCWNECVGTLCVKICGIGNDPIEVQLANAVKDFPKKLVREWHQAYGFLPAEVRDQLNNRVFTTIGQQYGGLSGQEAGKKFDEAIIRVRNRIEGKKVLVEYKNQSIFDYLKYLEECLQSSISYGGGKDLMSLRNVNWI